MTHHGIFQKPQRNKLSSVSNIPLLFFPDLIYISSHTYKAPENISQKFPEAVNRNNYNTAFLDMITKLGTSAQIGLHELLLGFL